MTNTLLSDAKKSVRVVLVSQFLVLVLGILKSLLIPALLRVEDFAYWQIYVFYITYAGLFTFGFNDGIYLRYGGAEFDAMDSGRVRSAIRLYVGYLAVAMLVMLTVCSFESDPDKRHALYFACLNIVVMGVMAVFSLALQATGRVRQFGVLNTIDKVVFLIALLALLFLGVRSFSWFIVADIVSKLIALAFMSASCVKLIKGKGVKLAAAVSEVWENVGCGLKLMLANLSGMLVLGVGRLVIEYGGTLENYAFYAFGISMTNLALVALASVSIVIYPVLKRVPQERYLSYYDDANTKLFIFSLIMLGGYFPVVGMITYLLPKYLPVVQYLNVLFVVTVLQGKMQLLNNNYYKALRLEGQMLRDNLVSLFLAVALSAAGYVLSRSVMAIALATLLTMTYRAFMSERFLRQAMGGRASAKMLIEAAAYFLFIIVTSMFSSVSAFAAYLCLFGAYAFHAKSDFYALKRLIMKERR